MDVKINSLDKLSQLLDRRHMISRNRGQLEH